MELTKSKFKQTEVGLIPEDWELTTLGKLIKLKNGYAFSSEHYSPKGNILITPGNFKISGGTHFNFKNTLYFDGEFSPNMVLKSGDLVLVMTDLTPDCNLLGKSGIINHNEIILHNQRIGKIEIQTIKTNKAFLNIYFNSSFFSNWMKSTATGSTVRHTSVPTINSSKIVLPTLKEQKAIASALSDVDELIAKLEKLIEKKKAIKQGAMQALLTPPHKGGKRLEGFSGEWVEKKLGDVADFFKGKGLPKSEINESGEFKCIHYGELFTKYNQIISSVKSRTNKTNDAFYSRINDVLMPTSDVTPNGLATSSSIYEDDVVLGGDILVIRPKPEILGSYLSYQVAINKHQIMTLISGTTVYHLYGSDMAKFKFYVPEIEEQKAIVNILIDLEAEILKLETERLKITSIKNGMMQELLTGKTRLV
jgi:type I restriction enzyme S subunit